MWKLLLPFFIVSGGLFALSLGSFIEYSSFAAALFKASIGVGLLPIIDRYCLPGFDTLDELRKGNVAVGLGLMSYAIIVVGALIAS